MFHCKLVLCSGKHGLSFCLLVICPPKKHLH
uniref:Uncharacterized protein n=1 Tax=Anguilla anguilla TaxID=7936 RepID=A0A0E9TBK4_ANGAN